MDIVAKEIQNKCQIYAKSFCLKNNVMYAYEDIVSDLILNTLKALPKCNGTSSLSTFIYGCNRNRVSRYWSIKKVNDAMGLGKHIQYIDFNGVEGNGSGGNSHNLIKKENKNWEEEQNEKNYIKLCKNVD